MTGKDHSKLLGIFFMVQGGLQLLGGIFMVLVYGGLGVGMLASARREDEQIAGGILLGIGVVVGVLVLLFAAFYLLTGWKLHKQNTGARIWGIIASCIALLGFPLGTALGIYGLWFFFGEQGKNFYAGNGGVNMDGSYPPPPPQSWQ